MEFILDYKWQLFISLEIASLLFLISFAVIRYALTKENIARVFLVLFVLFIILEAVLAFYVYQKTGEIETIQIVIFIFILYACTFGITDFKKLDRYFKVKIGNWRGVDLLTEKEKKKMAYLKDPKVVARKNRQWWVVHTIILFITLGVLWHYNGNDIHPVTHYLTDWAWFKGEVGADLPFKNEYMTNFIQIWLIIYVIDTLAAWYGTVFPSKEGNIK